MTSWGNSSIEGDGAPPVAANVKADRLFGGHGGVVAVRNGRIAEWGRALVFTGVNFDPTSLSDVREVAFGASSSACVMSVGGDVSCWGWNEFGQPGVPSTDTCIGVSGAGSCAQRPIRLPLAGRAVHIAGNCAVLENADVWCWRRAGLARVANFARP